MIVLSKLLPMLCVLTSLTMAGILPARADLNEMGSLGQEQAQEKSELKDMKTELDDIKNSMSQAAAAMGQQAAQIRQAQGQGQIKEFHLIAKEGKCRLASGLEVAALTYNGRIPGPVIRVLEGDSVAIVLHNQLKVPTSLYLQGLSLPHSVDGLPRRHAGLLAPGDTYVYQFVAGRPGTIWYHPQVIHTEQIYAGLSGALVIEPRAVARTYTKDLVMVIGQWQAVSSPAGKTMTCFTINGKTSPAIPPVEVNKGDRVRLRLINASQSACPLYLTGHRFEIAASNGGDNSQARARQDTLTLQPGDRYDLEFVADNPGVWSLSSLLVSQTTNAGKFPGGLACVVRYKNSD